MIRSSIELSCVIELALELGKALKDVTFCTVDGLSESELKLHALPPYGSLSILSITVDDFVLDSVHFICAPLLQ